jgi:putative NADH-flavin reductase
MRIVILGATGGIGRYLVSGALERGHSVTAFVRSPNKVLDKHRNLKVVAGDLFNEKQMAAALKGHDVILSAFGPNVIAPSSLRRDFGKAVVGAMNRSGVQRVQVVSSAFLFRDGGLPVFLLSHTLFVYVSRDMAAMEQEFLSTGLDWTMVRPPRLTNGEGTRAYRVKDGHLPDGGFLIARSDVAHFMLDEVERSEHVRQIVGVSN